MVGFRGLDWIYEVTQPDDVMIARAQTFHALIRAWADQWQARAALANEQRQNGPSNERWRFRSGCSHARRPSRTSGDLGDGSARTVVQTIPRDGGAERDLAISSVRPNGPVRQHLHC